MAFNSDLKLELQLLRASGTKEEDDDYNPKPIIVVNKSYDDVDSSEPRTPDSFKKVEVRNLSKDSSLQLIKQPSHDGLWSPLKISLRHQNRSSTVIKPKQK